jgi:hypothetical protein
MITMTEAAFADAQLKAFLWGAAALFATLVILRVWVKWFLDVRRAVVEGTQLQGEGLERMKRRGEL